MPSPVFTGLDADGNPVSGGKLFCYAAGTSTKQDTFSNSAMTVANANPVVMNSSGRAVVFLSPTSYKFVFAPSTDTDPPANPYWTVDNVSSVPTTNENLDIEGIAGENLTAGDCVYLSDGSGGGTTAGKWYKADASNDYSSAGVGLGFAITDISVGATGAIRQAGRITGLSGLTAGAVYYVSETAGEITSTPPAIANYVGAADSTTSLVVSFWPVSLAVTIGDISTMIAGAEGSEATIAARLANTLASDGYIKDPYGKQIVQTAGTGSHTGRIATFFDSAVNVPNSGSGETTAWTKSLPANTLAENGQTVRVTVWGHCAANANTKTLKCKFGAATLTVFASAFGSSAFGSSAVVWYADFIAIRGSASTQAFVVNYNNSVPATVAPIPVRGTGTSDLTTAITVSVTIQGTSSNDIIVDGLTASIV